MPQAAAAAVAAVVGAVSTATAVVAGAASQLAFAAGASASTSFTIGAAAATAFKLAGITALSVAANALFAPQIGAAGAPTEWRSDPNAGLPFVAGRLGVGGNLIYSKEFGADNRYLGNVTVYSRNGPVNLMGAFFADGVSITFGSGGVATNGGNIAGNMWLSSQTGLQPEPTNLQLPSGLSGQTFTGWTVNHKLSGCAADLQVMRQDSKFKTYPAGQPRRYREIEGILSYDPRLDSTYPGGDGACRIDDRSTYVYTTNAIIHALNWAIGYYENGKPVGGLADAGGPTLAGIDVDAFIAAANIADANGWTGLGARYSTADDKHQVLLAFLQAGGALYSENAGRISCVSRGAIKTSVMTLTRGDTAGPITIDAIPPRRNAINSIIPRCVQESFQWEPVDLDPVEVSSLVTTEGLRRRNKDYPFVTDSVQASQLAALDILDAREPLTGSAPLKPYARDLKPGDAFTWDEPGFLLDGVKCVVMERSYNPQTDTVEITWRSETDSKIAFALGLDPAPPTFPSLTPANPSFVPVPSTDDWTVTGGSIGNPGFVEGPAITIDGDVASLTGVTDIIIDFKADGDVTWVRHGQFPLADFDREQILGLLPETDYEIRLLYVNEWGVIDASAEQVLTATTGPQRAQEALLALEAAAAEAGSALEQAIADAQADADQALEDARENARRLQREGRERLANLATVLASIDAEARVRANDDSLQRFEIVRVDERAGAARALAEDIITLDISPTSALIERFQNVESVADDAAAGVTTVTNALADEVEARAQAINSVIAAYEAADTALGERIDGAEDAIAARATIAQLLESEANAERARARILRNTEARFAATLAAIRTLTEVTSEADAATIFEVRQANVRLGLAEASITDIINLAVAPDSALAERFSGLDAKIEGLEDEFEEGGRVFVAESEITTLFQVKADADDLSTEATWIQGLVSRVSQTEDDVGSDEDTPSESGSLFARTTFNAQTSASLTDALASYGFSAEAIVPARDIPDEVDGLRDEIDDEETGLAARALASDLVQAEASFTRAQARALRQLQASLANALAALQSLQQVTAEADSVTALRIDRTRAELDAAVAEVVATTYTRTTLDDAFAAWGLQLTSTFQTDIPGRVDGVEADLDPNEEGSLAEAVATINADYITSSSLAGAFAAFNLDLEATYNVTQRFEDIEDEFDPGVEGSFAAGIVATYLATADAESALSEYGLSLTAEGPQPDLVASAGLFIQTFTDGAGNALASLDLITAASGGNPALVSLRSGDGASEALIVGDRVVLANLGAGEDEIRPVLEASNGRAFFAEPIYTASGAGKHTINGFFGPAGQEMWLWTGDDTIFADTATRQNCDYALGVDGTVIFGPEGPKPWLAREPQEVQAQDGDPVVFDPPFGATPRQFATFQGLAPLETVGEAYDVRLVDFTTDGEGRVSGATMLARIIPTTSFAEITPDGGGTFGGEFIDAKYFDDAERPYLDRFEVTFSGNIRLTTDNSSWIDIEFGLWVIGEGLVKTIVRRFTQGQLGVAPNTSDDEVVRAFSNIKAFVDLGTADMDGAARAWVGVNASAQFAGSETVTTVNQVTYDVATAGTDRTATPGSAVATVLVYPPTAT